MVVEDGCEWLPLIRVSREAVYRELLKHLRETIKTAKEMMESGDEDVKVFAVDAFITLSKWIIALIEMLKEETKLETIEMEDRNPLARRARLDR